MERTEIGDVEIAYETAGDGDQPVLLIMGYGVPGHAWRYQIPSLSEKHPVAWFDNRGCGSS